MNKYIILGLCICIPLGALAAVFYYSDYGMYLRLQYKCERYLRVIASGGTPDPRIAINPNPEYDALIESGYLRYYYKEFDNTNDSPESLSFWKQARKICIDNHIMYVFSRSDITHDLATAHDKNNEPLQEKPIYVYFLCKEPEYSQLVKIIDASYIPSTIQSKEKPCDIFGRPYSFWSKQGPYPLNTVQSHDE